MGEVLGQPARLATQSATDRLGTRLLTDSQILLPQTAGALNFPPDVVREAIGTIDPHRSIVNQRAYITAFFDTHVRHRDSHLLDHPSPRFPEMQFLP